MKCEVEQVKQSVLSLLVANNFSVLTRTAGLFSRMGYNIKSLSSGETEDPRVSRLTIVTEGQEEKLELIWRQALKLEDMRNAALIPPDLIIQRELILLKLRPKPDQEEALVKIREAFDLKEITRRGNSVIYEMTGPTRRVDELVEQVRPFHIVEISRTGVAALENSDSALAEKPLLR